MTDIDKCDYCGEDYTDPNGVASDEYMWTGHILNDCPDVPEDVFDYVNAPPQERKDIDIDIQQFKN